MSKGDKPRRVDRERYDRNWDEIRWKRRVKKRGKRAKAVI